MAHVFHPLRLLAFLTDTTMQNDEDNSHLDISDPNDLAHALLNGCFLGSRDPEIKKLIDRAASGAGEYCNILASTLVEPTKVSKPKQARRAPFRGRAPRRAPFYGHPMPWPPRPKKQGT